MFEQKHNKFLRKIKKRWCVLSIGIVLWLVSLGNGQMLQSIVDANAAGSPVVVLVHHWQSASCTGGTCSTTITGGITAGNFIDIKSQCLAGGGGPFKISSVSGSAGPMTEAGVRGGATGEANGYYDEAYIKQADSLTFSGPFVVTYSGTNGGCQVNIREYSTTLGGVLTLDAVNDTWNTGSSTTFNGVDYTLTGTGGVQVQCANTNTHITAVSTYGNLDAANDETGSGCADLLNTTAAHPGWTATATVSSMATWGSAFTFNPTAGTFFSMMDSHSGTNGNVPTAANLKSSTFGATGLCGASSSDCVQWTVTGTGVTYATAAYKALIGSAPRFYVGGASYTDASSVGLRLTTANNTASYVSFFFPQAFDWTGNMGSSPAALRAQFSTSLIASDTLNVDILTLFGGGSGGSAAFTNAILAVSGGNLIIDLEAKDTVPSQGTITISSATTYIMLLSYVANGGSINTCSGATCGRLRVCDTSNNQVGSDLIITNSLQPAGKAVVGNSNGLGLTVGKFIDFDKIQTLYAGKFTFPATGCL